MTDLERTDFENTELKETEMQATSHPMDRLKALAKKLLRLPAFVKNSIIVLVLALVALIVVLSIPEPQVEERHENFDIQNIAELSTLECRYHNVAYDYKKTGLFDLGHKEIMLEFDGIITVGIDLDEVYVSQPSKKGVVKVYLPDPKILSTYYDKSTIKKPVEDTSLFQKVTLEEEIALVESSLRETESDPEVTSRILEQAKLNARNLVEQHIINVGNLTGQNYTVVWLDSAPTIKD